MNVYIYGGQKTNYLQLQIKAIQQYVNNLKDIYYVQPPLCGSQKHIEDLPPSVVDVRLSSSEVPIRALHAYMQDVINYCLSLTPEMSLFLHGDCIPFDSISQDVLLNNKFAAGTSSSRLQWYMSDRVFDEWHRRRPGHAQYYPSQVVDKEQWSQVFGDLPYRFTQIYQPAFYHLDDYRKDDSVSMGIKAKAYELLRSA